MIHVFHPIGSLFFLVVYMIWPSGGGLKWHDLASLANEWPNWPINGLIDEWPINGRVVLIGGADPRAGKPENPTLPHLGR